MIFGKDTLLHDAMFGTTWSTVGNVKVDALGARALCDAVKDPGSVAGSVPWICEGIICAVGAPDRLNDGCDICPVHVPTALALVSVLMPNERRAKWRLVDG